MQDIRTIQILINGVDKTNIVNADSFTYSDSINESPSTCSFSVRYLENGYRPEESDLVEVYLSEKILFTGRIQGINIVGDWGYQDLYLSCKDLTEDLDSVLIAEIYENKTVSFILNDLISKVNAKRGINLTANNISNGDVTISLLKFNYQPASQCIQRVAQLLNSNWYISADRDLWFYGVTQIYAPFSLTETNYNYIRDTLNLGSSLDNLKNHIYVHAGKVEGNISKEKIINADGVTATYQTDWEYAKLPTITLNGSPLLVGTMYLDKNENDFDCMWGFQEKIIKFKASNIPELNDEIIITGTTLSPILVQVRDSDSIDDLGLAEYNLVDTSIKSREEAYLLGKSQLRAYSRGTVSGSFETYLSGLKSGQTIIVNFPSRKINNVECVIQNITAKINKNTGTGYDSDREVLKTNLNVPVLTDDDNEIVMNEGHFGATVGLIYTVQISTNNDANIIQFFQSLLKNTTINTSEGNETIDKSYLVEQDIVIVEGVVKTGFSRDDIIGVYGLYLPSSPLDNKRTAIYGKTKYR